MITKGKFKLFVSKQCQLCVVAKELLKGRDYTVYDTGTVDGLAEASYYGVLSTPTLLMVNDQGEEVKRFVGENINKEMLCV